MRIAIISDIHANFPALEQTLKSIEEHNIDALYCLGDLVGYNLCPNAVINEIRKSIFPPLQEITMSRLSRYTMTVQMTLKATHTRLWAKSR